MDKHHFLYQACAQWNAKFSPSSIEPLPGEKSLKVKSHSTSISDASVSRCSSLNILRWVYARIIGIFKAPYFRGGNSTKVTLELLSASETFLVKQARSLWSDEENMKSFYRPVVLVQQDGLWVVGLRIFDHSPLTPNNKPQIWLPRNHQYTKLCMLEAHRLSGHQGREATVAEFCSQFWISHASKMSKNICESID